MHVNKTVKFKTCMKQDLLRTSLQAKGVLSILLRHKSGSKMDTKFVAGYNGLTLTL